MILGPTGQPATPGAPPQLVDPSGAPVSSGTAALPQASRPVTAEDLQELLARMGATATHISTKNANKALFSEAAVWLVDMWNHIAALQTTIAELRAAAETES